MRYRFALLFATALVCAPLAAPAFAEDGLRRTGSDPIERLRETHVIVEFQVRSPMTVGLRGEIGWVAIHEAGSAQSFTTSNFSGTPLKAGVRLRPGIYDVYVLSQDAASRQKFVRRIDVTKFKPGDIIETVLDVSPGWDAAVSRVEAGSSAPDPTRGAGQDETESLARKRAAQAVDEAREAEQIVRKRAAQSLQDARDAEQAARRRAAAAEAELQRALSSGRSARAVEDAKEADALARKRLARAAEDIQEAQRVGEKRIAQAVDDRRHAEEGFAALNSGAPSGMPVRPQVAVSRPVEPSRPAASNGRSARGTFSLRIFEAVRFSDGAVVKSGGPGSDVQFTYQMRRGMAYVYLGAERIRELGSPVRFRPADAAGWKDYILGPAPGYYGVVSKGKAYLVRIESYENQGKAASYWKLNGTWEALD